MSKLYHLPFILLTLGTKTKQRVNVVQKMARKDVKANCVVGRSWTRPTIGITRAHGMITLYTDKPIILLSFRAAMCTLRVSQAKYAPNNSSNPRRNDMRSYYRPPSLSVRRDFDRVTLNLSSLEACFRRN